MVSNRKAHGFNPCAYEVKNWFQAFDFRFNLHRYIEEDHALRQQRMFLRDVVTRLLYRKQWRDFSVPLTDDDVPGYAKKVSDPMDLSTLLWRVDSGWYLTVEVGGLYKLK
jgi:hypothetical protein